jgi:hypothetical protein
MGIKHLNSFLLDNCSTRSIYKANLRQFANKTLIIDTSIYLYKFAEKNAVAENMYLLISVFLQHNITPVFVFDGKPPPEKKQLLIKRKIEKDAAEERYNALKTSGESTETTAKELEMLKRQFVRVTESDIAKSKEIMQSCGVPFIESRGESDGLCALLVKHGFAWACVSDDMDMFLYGCPRVIRHLSLLHNECSYYDTESILADLDMTQDVFNDIAILSGTDYNINNQKSLSETVRLYMRYREWLHANSGSAVETRTFCQWLMESTEYVSDKSQFERIRKMFDLNAYFSKNREEFKAVVDKMPFQLCDHSADELHRVLKSEGFIFV